MFFIVKGLDGTDEAAPQRRQAARTDHLAMATQMREAGTLLMAAAYIDNAGQMKGSLLIFNVESRSEIDIWLAQEPYMRGNVWESVDIQPCKIPSMFLN